MKFKRDILITGKSDTEVLDDFLQEIGGEKISETEFTYKGENWFVDWHPSDHSSDIIVEEAEAEKHDKFLLIKSGRDKAEILGWVDKELLTKIPARDIYRTGKKHFVVMDTNVNDLASFELVDENLVLKEDFIINQQEAENLGHSEMISGYIAGIHHFIKKTGQFFKDINQKDEFVLGDKRIKIFTRDYLADEDMLIPEDFYQKRDDITHYVLCKIKGGKYSYLGYVTREVVSNTRVVQMVAGTEEVATTGSGDIRRMFAEQYLPMSDLIEIWEKPKEEEAEAEPQSYVPLHNHSEWSVGDGFGTVAKLVDAAKKSGFKTLALTDHGTMAGVWEFQKACLLKGVKPIIGCEFYVEFEGAKCHLIVLAKNEIGWRNMLKIHEKAVREGFHYKPTAEMDDFFDHSEGLIITSACISGPLCHLIRNQRAKEAQMLARKFKQQFGEDFYLEIQPNTCINNQKVMQKIHEIGLREDIKCVIATDTHYPMKEDKKFHEAVKAIAYKRNYGEAGFDDDCFFLMKDADLQEKCDKDAIWMKDLHKEFMKNTFEVADKCNFTIEPGEEESTLPKFKGTLDAYSEEEQKCIETVPELKEFKLREADKIMTVLAYRGLKEIGFADNKEYVDRLNLEIGRIV